MAHMRKLLDTGSMLVMMVTVVLFVVALFVKGLGHDLLLEAGVLLVSIKLMIMGYRNALSTDRLHEDLRTILVLLTSREGGSGGGDQV
jgi:hypothetical protein